MKNINKNLLYLTVIMLLSKANNSFSMEQGQPVRAPMDQTYGSAYGTLEDYNRVMREKLNSAINIITTLLDSNNLENLNLETLYNMGFEYRTIVNAVKNIKTQDRRIINTQLFKQILEISRTNRIQSQIRESYAINMEKKKETERIKAEEKAKKEFERTVKEENEKAIVKEQKEAIEMLKELEIEKNKNIELIVAIIKYTSNPSDKDIARQNLTQIKTLFGLRPQINLEKLKSKFSRDLIEKAFGLYMNEKKDETGESLPSDFASFFEE